MKTLYALCALLAAAPVLADAPAFDRPGIAFSTSTLPPGGTDVELGLPDISSSSAGGTRATLVSADATVRHGVTDTLELQVSMPLFNWLRVRDASGRSVERGIGDAVVGAKLALPSSIEPLSWAALAGVSMATGDDAFTSDATVYSLGVTAQWSFDDAHASAWYVDVDRSGSRSAYTVSPSYGWAVSDRVGAFVEAGVSHADGANDWVGGGGVTFMWLPNVQLDASADAGLTSRSTDLQAGVGASIYFGD